MVERALVIAAILERAAEREVEMERVDGSKVAAKRGLHRLDVAVVEAEALEVGEAPPRLAVSGGDLDRLAQRLHRLGGLAKVVERVAEAHPQEGAARLLAKQRAVHRDLFLAAADQAQQRRVLRPQVERCAKIGRNVLKQGERGGEVRLLLVKAGKAQADQMRRRGQAERPMQ